MNWPDLHCREIYRTHSSCTYYLAGLNDWGTGSWGIGATPQEAYDDCNAKGGDCERNPIKGGCADGSRPDWSPIVHHPIKTYRVIVAGFSRTADGASHVAAAEAAGPNYDYALASAKRSCHIHHPLVPECFEVSRYEHGCQSAAIGINNKPNVLETYYALGSGATKKDADADALKNCHAIGADVDCDPTQTSGACSY